MARDKLQWLVRGLNLLPPLELREICSRLSPLTRAVIVVACSAPRSSPAGDEDHDEDEGEEEGDGA